MSLKTIPLPAVVANFGQTHGSIRYTPGKPRASTPPSPISERASEDEVDLRHEDLFERIYDRHPGIDMSPEQSSIASLAPEANTNPPSVESSGYSEEPESRGCGCLAMLRWVMRALCATPD